MANFRSAPLPVPASPPPRCLNHIKVKGGKEGEGDLEEGESAGTNKREGRRWSPGENIQRRLLLLLFLGKFLWEGGEGKWLEVPPPLFGEGRLHEKALFPLLLISGVAGGQVIEKGAIPSIVASHFFSLGEGGLFPQAFIIQGGRKNSGKLDFIPFSPLP